ncbi:MAG: tandem-95 repeat protein, partial [Chloroflexi bacterium]|nr:tandem-95 repeat protein [Chloroflexota bacterium]
MLDGLTQPGASCAVWPPTLLIEINGANAGADVTGLVVSAGSSTIRGLVINRFTAYNVELNSSGGNTLECNFIGTNAAGTLDLGSNLSGVWVNNIANNTVGGSVVSARNLISGNNVHGVWISGAQASANLVENNYIGTNAAANADLGNSSSGVYIAGAASATVRNNVLSGNNSTGITIEGGSGHTISSNRIGTTGSGVADLGNTSYGVLINGSSGNSISGSVISGNDSYGVYLLGAAASGNTISGNTIGMDISGTAALGNTGAGIVIDNAPNNTIGGITAGARNLISGNEIGIYIFSSGATGNVVQGNWIGVSASGTLAFPNRFNGIFIDTASGNTIGGTVSAARNLISGNGSNGVHLNNASSNIVAGNWIGTDSSGSSAIPNNGNGVFITNGSSNMVGGTAGGAGNRIAFNALKGVYVFSGSGNAVLGNAIYSNTDLGIDLGANGVTLNDPGDSDTGANTLQNFPVLTSAAEFATVVGGTLNSTPNTNFRIEIFANTGCDTATYGEGQTLIGSGSATTNDLGNVTFSVNVTALVRNQFITATATNANNNTSEFSACLRVSSVNVPPTVVNDSASTPEDTAVTLNVLANDSDPNNDLLTVINFSAGSVAGSAVNCATGGNCTYTPAPNFFGSDSFTYTASDGNGGTAVATVTITVTPVNDPPVANPDSASTAVNTPVTINVLANDSDIDGGALTVSAFDSASAQGGTVNCVSAGNCTYTPRANFTGTDTYNYTVSDGNGGTASALVTVTIGGTVNRAPVANPDTATAQINLPVTIAVLLNDTDPDNNPLSVGAFDSASARGGTVSCTPGGSCTYTPPTNFVGTDTFTYRASDGVLLSNVATVTISVISDTIPAECVGIEFTGMIIYGTDRYNEIYGTEGNDLIYGFGAGDHIYGLGGDDCLVGGRGHDELYGGDGNDILIGEDGHDMLFGGGGDDRLFGGMGFDYLRGDAGNDQLYGGGDSDWIQGDEGDDSIYGQDGSDAPLTGGPGSDVIYGGPGHDELFGDDDHYSEQTGASGNDALYGEDGFDLLYGGGGSDMLDAGSGIDMLFGNSGDDTLFGGPDGDEFLGGSDFDTALDFDFSLDYLCVDVEQGCTPPAPPVTDRDDDGDGVNNTYDVCAGFDDHADMDGDGIPDGCDPLDDR